MIETMQVKRLLGRMFPLMALTGLLLAGWGLIITPDDMKTDSQAALWGANTTHVVTNDAATPNTWRE
jgi:hypothetical protein